MGSMNGYGYIDDCCKESDVQIQSNREVCLLAPLLSIIFQGLCAVADI